MQYQVVCSLRLPPAVLHTWAIHAPGPLTWMQFPGSRSFSINFEGWRGNEWNAESEIRLQKRAWGEENRDRGDEEIQESAETPEQYEIN